MSADQGEHEFVGTRPDPLRKAFVQFRADQARSCAYKLRNPGGGQSMIWAMPVREDQARASACDYDGTVAHDGQLDEETVAEQVRLADIGRKLLLVTGRELGDLLEVPHSRCSSSWSWLNRGRCSSVRRWHPCSAPNPVGIRTFQEG